MDEMHLVAELGGATPLPTPDELAPARAALLGAIAAAPVAGGPVRPRRRWGIGATAVGIAAAVAAALVLAPVDELGLPVPRAAADPVRVLQDAAAAARRQPDLAPRPDQFVYVRIESGRGLPVEQWSSVDGTHDGLSRVHGSTSPVPGCREGVRIVPGDDPASGGTGRPTVEECVPRPAFVADLPTDGAAVLAYLHASTYGEGDTLNDLGNEIVQLAGGYLRPAARAALFEAMAEVPGLSVRTDASDATGRRVLGLSWDVPDHGRLDEFYFDPDTYAYLGSEQFGAVTAWGIVDGVDQRP